MSNSASVLIIGMNGFIGRALYRHFLSSRWNTIGVSHVPCPQSSFQLDLYHPDFQWLEKIGHQLDYAIICSAVSNIDQCKRDPAAYVFNVINTIYLIDHLYHFNIIPFFLSSNMVFEGTSHYYHEEEDRHPVTTYGKHKKAVEDYLLNMGKPYLILRLCKIIGSHYQDGTLLTGYLDDLLIREKIVCARDQYLTVTSVDDLVLGAQMLMERNARGVFHFSSHETHSRLQLAIHVARFFRINPQYIVPCFINDFDFLEPRPQYNSLDSTKIIGMYNFEFTNLQNCLSRIKKNYFNTPYIKQAINY